MGKMKTGRMAFWFLVIGVIGVMAYVRLAPSDVARWHVRAEPVGTQTQTRSAAYIWREVVSAEAEAKLQALSDVIERTPRTALLAGSVEEGQLTFVTRSRVFGFPDYTTVGVHDLPDGARILEVYGRARFGQSDLGVNAQRIRGWIAKAQM